MDRNKYLFVGIQQIIFTIYLIATSVFFFLALKQGNEGVTFVFLGGGDDGYFYWVQAQNIAKGEDAVLTSIYPLIIGYLIKLTNIENVYIIRIFNYLGFLILTYLGFNLCKILIKDNTYDQNQSADIYRAGILMSICFICYASLFINLNISIIRDVWIYTLYLLVIILSIKLFFYKSTSKIFAFMIFIPALLLLGEFRGYALVSFLASTVIYLVYTRLINKKNMKMIAVLLFSVLGVCYSFFKDLKIPYINKSLRDALNYRQSALDIYAGGSQMWISLDQPDFLRFLFNYLHSYLGNLVGPLPWHITGLSTLVLFFVESIPMVLILVFIWKNRDLLSKIQQYILLHSFVWIGLISITNDNVGTATRLRSVGWILILIVFVTLYIERQKQKHSN